MTDEEKFIDLDADEFVGEDTSDSATLDIHLILEQAEAVDQWLWDIGSLPGLTKREQEAAYLCWCCHHPDRPDEVGYTAEEAAIMMSAVFLPSGKLKWDPITADTVRRYLREVEEKAEEFGSAALKELAESHREDGSQ